MGKSKFPGKPSKLVQKKRVSVLFETIGTRENGGESSENSENLSTTTTTSIKHGCCEQTQPDADDDNDNVTDPEPNLTNDVNQENSANSQEMEPSSETCTTSESNKCDNIDNNQASTTTQASQSKSTEEPVVDSDKNNKKRVTFRNTLETSDDFNVVKKVYNPNFNGPIVSIIKKESLKRPILVYKKNCIVRPSRLTEIVKNSGNNIDKLNSLKFGREYNANHNNLFLNDDKSSNIIVDSKFSISHNSSKLIKPGKRFYHNGEEHSSSKKIMKSSSWCNELQDDDSQTSRENKKFGFSFVDELDLKKGFKQKEVFHKTSSTLPSSSATATTLTDQSKSILRKPMLQLSSFGLFSSQDKSPPIKSPFSLKLDNSSLNSSSSIFTTSLLCHVCNSITTRKQPRKYGAVCCELCRKFMSKMIKRLASSNKNPLSFQCTRADGSCCISPITKLHKNIKAISKERCYACWLKKCLQNFQLPSAVKGRLMNSLPKYLNDIEKVSTLSKFSFNLSNPLAKNNFTFGAKPDIKPNVEEVFKSTFSSNMEETKEAKLECDKDEKDNDKEKDKSLSVDIPKESVLNTGMETRSKSSPNVSTNHETTTTALLPSISSSDALRQRTLLKGPRVKHVCRSAQIVLGQPVAIFSNGDESQELDIGDIVKKDDEINDLKMDIDLKTDDSIGVSEVHKDALIEMQEELKTEVVDNSTSTENSNENENPRENREIVLAINKVPKKKEKPSRSSQENIRKLDEIKDLATRKLDDVSKPITRKLTRPSLSLSQAQNLSRLTSNLSSSKRLLFQHYQSQQRNTVANQIPMISIDFWENYDPAEVSRTGFGLILSEKVSIKSLCFLCGSCGTDPLIYCVCCCEPYHYYCVEDEFNIKLQVTNDQSQNTSDFYQDLNFSGSPINNSNTNSLVRKNFDMPFHKRLNWLCPRCTVCHTCNMSTGSKVKCQKCEKNYHPTCLGTSKRLLGADRPLICAGCLKCKSCGITNVTKFVGNLPMCTNCFKLRQKGNYCPLCQKCYENNDYDLKMMECGDCRRWVHAKCEGLIDEQYNLLSVLPENIEFYCKKCSENNPLSNVWRDSVAAEFRSSLMSVIRLLSKSRHACVLLRLSPRKKSHNCTCNNNNNNNKLSIFNSGREGNLDYFYNSSQPSIKENDEKGCNCNKVQMDFIVPNINEIKQKIMENKYHSLHAFNYDMNKILSGAQSEDLQTTYNEIISEIFPWYQNETKACTDALVETMNDTGNEYLDDMINQDETEFFTIPTPNLPEDVEKEGFKPFQSGKDTRACMFCKKEGEFSSNEEGRLLYSGNNTWVHSNCALWSAEVYEEIDGSLQNVHSAISRGRMIKCGKCGIKGATVGCNFKNCGEHYHFMCAKECGVGFLLDKRVFCPQHLDEMKSSLLEQNFEVNRSVYVELDRKKKKTIEASKVQFLMGSLYISKLGRIVPPLSDYCDFLVPVDFECSRLYWSAKKPWSVVEYTIKVSIQRSNYPTPAFDKGINFTVDHSTNPQMVQKNLKKISLWHSSISQVILETQDDKKYKQVLINEETNDEEPQNNNDLFPPEIKDAIFEDLPHDVLDGISMFDIFPKNDCRYLDTGEDEDEENSNNMNEESADSNDSDLNGFLENFQEDGELRKSPSQMKRLNFFQQQQKLQQSPKECELKRRKLSTDIINDTNNNKNGVDEIPTKRISTNLSLKFVKESEITKNLFGDAKSQFCDLKIPQLDGLNDEIFQPGDFSGAVMCDRCRCTYRNRDSYDRHLQTCENVATSESDSESMSPMQNQDGNLYLSTSQQSITGMSNNNVISMINQQQNQSMSTSIPIVINPFQSANNLPIQSSANLQNAISLSNAPISLQLNSDGNLGLQNVIVDQQGQQIFTAQPLNIGNFGQTILPVRNFASQATNNIPYLNASQQFISLPTNGGNGSQQLVTFAQSTQSDINSTTTSISHTKKQLILPQNIGKTNQLKTVTTTKVKATAGAQKSIMAKKKEQQQVSVVGTKNISVVNYQQPQQSQQSAMQQPQQTQNIIFQQPNAINSQYPLILNQNGNVIQYYAAPTASAQSDSQNTQLQYLPAITGASKDGSKYITTSATATPQLFQNAFQLPTNNTNNLMLTNGLQVVPVQNQVIGTLIQPQLNQCGLMSTEQMMLAQTPTLEMVSDPTSGCMYLTSQPVYYGLETIVQNTVMSSQQFVSTAMQGVLSQNSSFSATTTQVFQASKIEPIMEIPTGYVVLNTDNLNGQQQIAVQQAPQQKITQTSNVLSAPIQQTTINDSCFIMEDKKIDQVSGNFSSNANATIVKTAKTKMIPKVSKIQPQLVSKVTPTNHETIQKVLNNEEKLKMSQQCVTQQVQGQTLHQQQQQFIKMQNPQRKTPKNVYRAIGPKVIEEPTNGGLKTAAYIKPKVASAKPIQPIQQNSQIPQEQTMNINPSAYITKPMPQKVQEISTKILVPQTTDIITNNVTLDQTYRTVQNNMIVQANKVQKVKEQQQQQQQQKLEMQTICSVAQPVVSNIPTNVVNPMQNTSANIFSNLNISTTKNKQNINNRPTNRVLPMQATTQRMGIGPKGKQNKNLAIQGNPTNTINNQQVIQNELVKDNYCEKIKSIALELQSSKNDSLFDRLRLEEPQNNLLSPTSTQNTNLNNNNTNNSAYLGIVCDKTMEDSLSPQPLLIDVRTTTHTTTTLSPSTTTSTYLVPSTSSSTDVSQSRMITQQIPPSKSESAQSEPNVPLLMIEPDNKSIIEDVTIEKEVEQEQQNIQTIFQEISKQEKLATPSPLCPDYDEPSSNSNNLDENSTRNSLDDDDVEYKVEKENYNAVQFVKTSEIQQKTPQKSLVNKVSGPKILFEIQSEDGFTYKSTSITEIWEKLFETVQLARKAHGLMPLPEGRLSEMTGDQMLGLKTNALKYLLEQLPGVEKCSKYSPKYHKSTSAGSSSVASSTATSAASMTNNNFSSSSSQSSNSNLSSASSVLSNSTTSLNQYLLSDSDEILFENIYGAARFEPYSTRSEYDMFSWLASRHRKQPVPVIVPTQNEENLILRRGTGSNLPMAMKYRTLKETYKKNVGVYRSHIHGRGLFCTRDIEAGEMVIEYAGQLIRSTLTDKRERYYDSKGIGCYMFKIDDNLVVDATMSGTAARFINHSCDPNCYSKVVDILGQKHIIIFALRRIVTGEELTYDYKFPFEDVKIPCTCGAKRCRKYLN